jgi:hypothetical protein
MVQIKVKGTGIKAANSPEPEPDFYALPPVVSDGVMAGACDGICASSDHNLVGELQQQQSFSLEQTIAPLNVNDSRLLPAANDCLSGQ